ncbi:Receptor-like serine/threonine-protein kinase SD1-7 [Citrus sinensis]|uniref:Receptor-like serine/threonine-protein kinase SD1-7 n=1 Tax=Citrus sinensis TaxID=2711 RepID=A0ACB8NZF8_CITSI|nr:Receptor-like serine/threonine-protein kinase SD1-7 [Citrus sinensis]
MEINLLHIYIFSSLIFLLRMELSLAADTITPETFIRDGEKLVSSSQRFELGFFSPRNSKNRYLGVWYKKIPDTVVWVANRNSPIFNPNTALTFSNNGNLVLLSQRNGIIWSSNMSRKAENPIAQLLDTGNLVIRDNSSGHTTESYLWQSFDYPTDSLLEGMKLGWDLKNGLERYLSSWESTDDPSPGNFTFRLVIQVIPKLCAYNGSVEYTCTGPWNGVAFGAAPTYTSFLYEQVLVQSKDEISFWYESYNSPNIMILKVNPSGLIQRLIWNERSTAWDVLFSAPDGLCSDYGYCGANAICSADKTPNCECLNGFKLKSQDNQTWPRKCESSHSSDCKSGGQFIKLDDIKAPALLEVSLNESMNLKQCEAECLKNCTCRAYTDSKLTGRDSGCLMWFGDLIDMRKTIRNFTGQSVYIRVPAPEPGKRKLLWTTTIVVLPVVLLAVYVFGRRRRKLKDKGAKNKSTESWFPFFSLASITAATDNFCEENKLGEGGFGPVYKGKLLNGEEVAVKRLSSQSGQGLEEFKNEMMLIAKLQHRNLVRLFGCCIEQDPTKKGLLCWGTRVRIIEGIAQGLLYLHQYSRLRVIHRDLKASNILLDKDMNPKISDFGMARMFGGDELQSNTKRIVGTYGYMSPEYALRGLFSIKSDVFSFGVLLLETLSSKKNTHFYNTDSLTLLGHAWNLWNDGRTWELMDPISQNGASYPILKRYINVALLCVQEKAADRPAMSEVVSMLSNEFVNLPAPQQPAFSCVNSTNMQSDAFSVNCVTHSVIDAR